MNQCTCGQPIRPNANHCPRCGRSAGWPMKRHLKWAGVALAVVAAFGLGLAARGPLERAGFEPGRVLGGPRPSASTDNWRLVKDKMAQGHAVGADEVRAALGAPDEVTGASWWYRPVRDTGSVTFRGGRVFEVVPPADLPAR